MQHMRNGGTNSTSIHWSSRPGVPRTHTTSRGRQPTDNKRIDRSSHCRPRQSNKMETSIAADLHYILVNICTGPAATVCRQNLLNTNGLETWRQLRHRFSIPTGTRSVGYLTKLLKPTLDENKFEEAFAQWEHDVQRYEQDNGTPLTRRSQNSNTSQRDKGSTTTTLTAERHNSHNSHNIQPDQDRHPGVLPVYSSIHENAGTWTAQQRATTKAQHQWTLEQRTKDTRAKVKVKVKAKERAKEKAARVTTTTVSTAATAKEAKEQ